MVEQRRFLKRHGFMVAAVALPILVVVAFALARWLPQVLVDDPHYELVYSEYSGTDLPRDVTCDINAVDGRVRVRWRKSDSPVYSRPARVWRLDPATGATTELPLPEPADLDAFDGTQDFFLEGLDGVRIDTSLRAPDGYEFEVSDWRGSGLIGDLFTHGSRGPRATIKKSGRVIALPEAHENAYSYETATFLGWAIPVEGGR